MTNLRVVTYNIHKGVQGFGPLRRLEIHNLGSAMAGMDADVLCLQEVRKMHRKESLHFAHWPDVPQADFLAPEGYHAVYQTNAVTRHGEHGNALLTRWPVIRHRHEDMSDHRLEQRGLLHVELDVAGCTVHVLVVHLGLIRGSRQRQLAQICRYVEREIAPGSALLVAGDFNDTGPWVQRQLEGSGLMAPQTRRCPTFPSRLPLVQLDHVFGRGLLPGESQVLHGKHWARMSDHLPLVTQWQIPSGVHSC
jgi:endonuclease/exonuclease/phosphatase family metal-dependent hydrolase